MHVENLSITHMHMHNTNILDNQNSSVLDNFVVLVEISIAKIVVDDS